MKENDSGESHSDLYGQVFVITEKVKKENYYNPGTGIEDQKRIKALQCCEKFLKQGLNKKNHNNLPILLRFISKKLFRNLRNTEKEDLLEAVAILTYDFALSKAIY